MQFSDAELLAGIKIGDSAVLRFLYKTYLTDVLRQGKRMANCSKEDAQDVFQDALVVIFNKLEKEDIDLTSSFKALFLGVSRIIWLTKINGEKIKTTNEDPDAFIGNADDDIYAKLSEELDFERKSKVFYEEFKKLGSECQRFLRLVLNGVTIAEATKVLSFSSESAARRRYIRCKTALSELIKVRLEKFK